MNLGQARAELAARGFNEIDPDRLDVFLNTAKNLFEDAYAWPWLESTHALGAAPMTIADLKQVEFVYDQSNRCEIKGTTIKQIVAGYGDPADQGAPILWYLDGEHTLKTWPTGTSAQLLVRYIAESPELDDDSDQPLIPARYHQTWIDLAVTRGHLDTGDLEQASSVRQVAGQDLALIIQRYELRNRQNGSYQTLTEPW